MSHFFLIEVLHRKGGLAKRVPSIRRLLSRNFLPTQEICQSWLKVTSSTKDLLRKLRTWAGLKPSITKTERTLLQEANWGGFFGKLGGLNEGQPFCFGRKGFHNMKREGQGFSVWLSSQDRRCKVGLRVMEKSISKNVLLLGKKNPLGFWGAQKKEGPFLLYSWKKTHFCKNHKPKMWVLLLFVWKTGDQNNSSLTLITGLRRASVGNSYK